MSTLGAVFVKVSSKDHLLGGGDRRLLKNADSWAPVRPSESDSVGGNAWESSFRSDLC